MCINPLTPVLPVTAHDQHWPHLYPSSAAGIDLSNDTQIRVIGSIEHEICTKMLNLQSCILFFTAGANRKNGHLTQLLASAHSPESEILSDRS